MKRQLIVALLSCAGAFVVVYMMRRQRNTLWEQIPQSEWEQVEALLRDGRAPETPLDALQVLADITGWLQEL